MRLIIPSTLAERATGESDPVAYYSRPGVGWLYRRRIELGLEMIGDLPPDARALEVGFAAGLVLYNLAPIVSELHGIDLDADPASVSARLRAIGVDARLVQGSVLEMGAWYPDEHFDLVTCFSVLEHVDAPDRALDEIARVLKPGGMAVIGMPAVNRLMEYAFLAIGFKGINDHHITAPATVWRLVQQRPRRWLARRRSMPSFCPFPLGLYHIFCLQKREGDD